MFDDKIEIKLNDKTYSARLDMKSIAEVQYHFKKLEDYMTVPQLFNGVFKSDVSIINEIVIQSVIRCHSQLTRENLYENMKLKDLQNIVGYAVELLQVSLPKGDDKKKVDQD